MWWCKLDRAIAIHQRQIAEHGGGHGIRDSGLLESALARPQNLSAYEPEADVASLAAAYAFGIAKNHPFVDGNKRTAYIVMELFLVRNGFELHAAREDKYLTFLSLAEGSISEDELAAWLRDRISPA
jgi:death-on-curing protein